MALSRSDYTLIASVIAAALANTSPIFNRQAITAIKLLTVDLVEAFGEGNPNFDADLFVTSALGELY